MKKFLLLSTGLILAFAMQAQNYDVIKNLLILNQYKKAKDDLDKAWGNAKFVSKPEAYLLKATIYGGLAMDSATRLTPDAPRILAEAETAFAKYREMQPDVALLTDPIYKNAPINIYSSLFTAGYKDYEAKSWQAGFDKFKKVVDLSDLMIDKKIIQVAADTNSLLLAGITAENAGLKEEAVKYYSRMADMKAGGQGFEGIYRFLVNYYAVKKDNANFEKYKAIGKQLYPESQYFTYDKVDFAVGLEEDINKKIRSLEETLAADPSNQKATLLLGEIIYDTLNSRKEGAVQPSNAADLETKMVAAFIKAASFKADDEIPYLFIGDHFINKSIRTNDAREAHAAAMKARTKPGTQASKEDIAKRDALDNEYANTLDAAREPYEKAAAIFAKKEKLSGQDKQQYKKVSGYLGDIYMNKKIRAKGKPADQAKYAADEKKWNDVYDTIK
ncbi:MAG: hypothetical protein H7Y42_02415 [Chitinophagaceae bacterium]|nr:hypothetical protein [Chitinophagaceae bacterium]